MNPMIGQTIIIAVLAVIIFFSARSAVRRIRAELRGECSCAGCSGCSSCSGSCGSSPECCACMQKMEQLKQQRAARSETASK